MADATVTVDRRLPQGHPQARQHRLVQVDVRSTSTSARPAPTPPPTTPSPRSTTSSPRPGCRRRPWRCCPASVGCTSTGASTSRCRSSNWLPLAEALRDAALGYGLKFDPQVTVNAAGILRVPNTWNHKTARRRPRCSWSASRDTPSRATATSRCSALLGAYMRQRRTLQSGAPSAKQQRTRTSRQASASSHRRCRSTTSPSTAWRSTTSSTAAATATPEPLWNLALYAASLHHRSARRRAPAVAMATRATPRTAPRRSCSRRSTPAPHNPMPAGRHCAVVLRAASGLRQLPAVRPGQDTVPPCRAGRRRRASPAADFMPAPATTADAAGLLAQQGHGHVCTTLYRKQRRCLHRRVIRLPDPRRRHRPRRPVTWCYRAAIGGVEHWRDVDVSASMQPHRLPPALCQGTTASSSIRATTQQRGIFSWPGSAHLQTIKRLANQTPMAGPTTARRSPSTTRSTSATSTDIVYRGKHADPNFTVHR